MTGRGPYPFLIAFCATRDHLAQSGTSVLFFFSYFVEPKESLVKHRHHVVKQIRGLVRIPFSNAPFGRKCQCSINFARWKNELIKKIRIYFTLNYHQTTQNFQSVRQSKLCHYRTCSETGFGKSKIEYVEKRK